MAALALILAAPAPAFAEGLANLSVSATASVTQIEAGEPFTYSVTITNTGPAPAFGVRLAYGLTGPVIESEPVVPPGFTCAPGSCTTEVLGVGESAAFTFNFVPTLVAQVVVTFGVGAMYTDDPDFDDNFKTVDLPPAPALPGEPVSVTVAADSGANAIALRPVTSFTFIGWTDPSHGTVSSSGGSVVAYTPEAGYVGPDSFTYTVFSDHGRAEPATVSITVERRFSIDDVTLPTGQTGVPYEGGFTASGGTEPYAFTVTTGRLPNGVGLYESGGFFGAPHEAGSFPFTLTVRDKLGATAEREFELTILPGPPIARDDEVEVAPFEETTLDVTSNDFGEITSIAFVDPPQNGAVRISGLQVVYIPGPTPAADSFTYTVTGPHGTSAPATVDIRRALPKLVISPGALPDATTGVAYDLSLTTSGGAPTGAYSYRIVDGRLPHGLDFSMDGHFSQAPLEFGEFQFTVETEDALGNTGAQDYVLTVVEGPPVARDDSLTTAYGEPVRADLTINDFGRVASIDIVSEPAHGSLRLFGGGRVVYTPAAGYAGEDSFTYTATGSAGTSQPATVDIVVGSPEVVFVTQTLPDAQAGAPYSFTLEAEGGSAPYTFVASDPKARKVGALPPGLSLSEDGLISGVPEETGSFELRVTAIDSSTGDGPFEATAAFTLNITVAAPAPVEDAATTAYGAPLTLDVTANDGGPIDSIEIVSGPAGGTARIDGREVTYTPDPDFFGEDSFTYAATGPGGTSQAVTVTVTVSPPPAPTVATPAPLTVTFSAANPHPSVSIDLGALVSGVYETIEIAAQPQHGELETTSSMERKLRPAPQSLTAVYRPDDGFTGQDSFSFVAIGPGGSSAPTTVIIDISGVRPVLTPLTATTPGGVSVSVDLTAAAQEGPFTAAAIVSISPADAGAADLVEGGEPGARTYRLDFTPDGPFVGAVVVSYTLANRFGVSSPGTVTITVEPRPDPTADPDVRGVIDAEAEAARRFAEAQVDNFTQRLESLHGEDAEGSSSFAIRGLPYGALPGLEELAPGFAGRPVDDDWFLAVADPGYDRPAAQASEPAAKPKGPRVDGEVRAWAGGTLTLGRRDPGSGRAKLDVVSSGLSVGADVRLAPGVVVGTGIGLGRDVTDIGTAGSQVKAKSVVGAVYGSFQPAKGAFLDGVVGAGRLEFDLRRMVAATGAMAFGRREGDLLFGSLSGGFDHRGEAWSLSSYGRLEFSRAQLEGYRESGAGLYDLSYEDRELRSASGVLGARAEVIQELRAGRFTPRLRLELRHDFEQADGQMLHYADWSGGPGYLVEGDGWARDRIKAGVGGALALDNGWKIDLDFEGDFARNQGFETLRLRVEKRF